MKDLTGKVVVLTEQRREGDTNFLYGQLGLVVDEWLPGIWKIKSADNDFDDYVAFNVFKAKEFEVIGDL